MMSASVGPDSERSVIENISRYGIAYRNRQYSFSRGTDSTHSVLLPAGLCGDSGMVRDNS